MLSTNVTGLRREGAKPESDETKTKFNDVQIQDAPGSASEEDKLNQAHIIESQSEQNLNSLTSKQLNQTREYIQNIENCDDNGMIIR